MAVPPDDYHRQCLAWYLRQLAHPGPAEWRDYAMGSGTRVASTVRVARIRMDLTGGGALLCHASLGLVDWQAAHVHQFVCIVDDLGDDPSRLVASMAHYSAFVSTLDHGHTVPVATGSPLFLRGYEGTLILEGGFYSYFDASWPTLAGTETSLFAAIPLTRAELEIKRSQGVDALFGEWKRTGRDLTCLRGRTNAI